jgi:PKD repeat protein
MAGCSRRLGLFALGRKRQRDPYSLSAVLAPRRLERRRLLDAAAPGLALEWLDAGDSVQAGADFAELADSPPTTQASVANSAPSVEILPFAEINEGDAASLRLRIENPDPFDMQTIEVDWGDGSPVDTFAVSGGSLLFSTTHRYLDDASGAGDVYMVRARVTDAAGDSATAEASIRVRNLAPTNLEISPIAPIALNGFARLELTFEDAGVLDTHVVEVNWGDGSAIETFDLAPRSRSFSAVHQYLIGDPGEPVPDTFVIDVRVVDDDLGEAVGQAVVTVSDTPPTNLSLVVPAAIDENSFAELNVMFDDPDLLDLHQVEIEWFDGSPVDEVTLPTGARRLTALHQYLDDNPSGTVADAYIIRVRVVDASGGAIDGQTSITVNNAAPFGATIDPLAAINENEIAVLTGAFLDPGTFDAHTLEVDWGDGSAVEILPVAAGSRTFTATHRYLNDGAPGAPTANYTVTVQVRDDDLGVSNVAARPITVNNAAPSNVVIFPVGAVDEGGVATLNATFGDPGTLDAHVYVVDWGDGLITRGAPAGRSFSESHTYADNGEYSVRVTVADDDGGEGVGIAAVTVKNVAPPLVVAADQVVNEGDLLSIVDIASFTDPGFANIHNRGNASNGGEFEETFAFEIDWGDGTATTTGSATIDAAGGPGRPTAGSFNGAHVYADNGVYTVTVAVADDDLGRSQQTLQVVVHNVDPTLRGVELPLSILEGHSFTLTSLGVSIQDPGFDNPANAGHPTNGGESAEFFIASTVDWGDGTPAEALGTTNRISGGPGVFTTADFVHDPHTYADNGEYTMTVRLRDDDGIEVTRTFTIVVENVAPTLTLTQQEFVVNEGETLSIADLGTFIDPGFDNALNAGNAANGGEVEETFTYTIDWGDGTVETMRLPASRASGAAGVLTTGSLADSHFYADNDADNKYTITVTLADDDGGVDSQSIEVTVLNVNPTLDPIRATDVTSGGETTLRLAFRDPGADSFEVLVDWGDKLGLPPNERFVPELVYAGPTPESFTLTHIYEGPPDPLHPSADITIRVQVHDDDFGTPLVIENGESNVEEVAISNPGAGQKLIRIDTSPKVPMLSFPPRPASGETVVATESSIEAGARGDIEGSAGESRVAGERYLELVVFNPNGTEKARFRLPSDALSDLPGLFQNLPDNHYAIYLVQPESDFRRLVIDVYVRNGRLIDPGDDTEGARDRPPTDESAAPPGDDAPLAFPPAAHSEMHGATGPPRDALPTDGAPRSAAAWRHGAALASAALALSTAGRSWRTQVDEALAKGGGGRRRRLQTVGHWRRKKPR